MLLIDIVAEPLALLGILKMNLFSFLFTHSIWYVPIVGSVKVNVSMFDHDDAKPPFMFIEILDSKSLPVVSNGHVKDIVPVTGAPKRFTVGFAKDSDGIVAAFVAFVPSMIRISLKLFSYFMLAAGR